MTKRGRKPINMINGDDELKIIKRNYYLDVRYTKALTVLSALTGKELSLLVNEAIGDLINKYQSQTRIDLLRLESIPREN